MTLLCLIILPFHRLVYLLKILDQFAVVSLGTNLIYYFTMRLRSIKLIGQRVDKKHKEYKEAKKSIKGILKRQQFRGNVVPWCQFADFELETSPLPTVLAEVYNQALQLAWSLKQKSTLEKALVSSFYVLAHLAQVRVFIKMIQ